MCAASPQTRKRRRATGGPQGCQLHVRTLMHELRSIQQLIRRDIKTQKHDLLEKNRFLSSVDGSSRRAFQRTSWRRSSTFSLFQIPWRRCQRRDVFECSSYMDPSLERRVVACRATKDRSWQSAGGLLRCADASGHMEGFAVDPSSPQVGFVLQGPTVRLPQLRERRVAKTWRRLFSHWTQVMCQVSWWTRLSAPVWMDVFLPPQRNGCVSKRKPFMFNLMNSVSGLLVLVSLMSSFLLSMD